MTTPTVHTNHVPRPIIELHELTNKEREELFGDMSTDDIYEQHGTFKGFRFKGNIYNLDDFMITEHELKQAGWDGHFGTSYFSAVVVKYANNYESVVVG